jgi:biopolymer transport protein ExbD
MRFLVHKRRSTPAVIIVALIDVLIVLLIFLMVTTTFKQQQSLRLNLPDSTEAKKEGVNEKETVVVNIDPAGIYSIGKDKTPLTFEQLETEIRSDVAKNPDLTLALNADEKAPWGRIVKVRDLAADAHIKPNHLEALTKQTAPP